MPVTALLSGPHRPLVIEPEGVDRHYWLDLWSYRELFLILAWRDVAVRYKQTVIGIAWAFVRPFLTMVVLTVVFAFIAKLPSERGAPYAVMVFTGLLPWTLFSSVLTDGAASVVTNAQLVGKVYFARMVIPLATIGVALLDFLTSLSMLVGLMIWYGIVPGWQILLLPFFVLCALLAALGPAMWLAAMIVKYRDFRFVVPFVTQIGLYASPVGFTSDLVPQGSRLLYNLNPLTGIINGFRWCILGGEIALDWLGLAVGLSVAGVLLWWGTRSFRRIERDFADLI